MFPGMKPLTALQHQLIEASEPESHGRVICSLLSGYPKVRGGQVLHLDSDGVQHHERGYSRCVNYTSATIAFLPAKPEDASKGCIVQPVFLGEPPASLKVHADTGGQSPC